MNSNYRYNSVFAIMKGIAIISVVLGHCSPSQFVGNFVNQYHLAVFFFVAGYFFKEEYLNSLRLYVVKRIKSLYMPYVSYCLAFLLLHNLFYRMGIYPVPLSFYESIIGGARIVFELACYEPLMGAMWFCGALLIVSFLSFGMMKVSSKKTSYVRLFTFVGAMVVGVVCCRLHIKSPYCLWQYLQICMIFYMGFSFRKFEGLLKSVWIRLFCIIIAMFVLALSTQCGIMAHLQPNNILGENIYMIMLIAFVGCLGVYSISSLVAEFMLGKVLAKVGDYSFSIMALHFLAFKLVVFLQCVILGQSFSKLSAFPCLSTSSYWWVIYLLVGIFLPMVISKGYLVLVKTISKDETYK